jgi:hypothetical protein
MKQRLISTFILVFALLIAHGARAFTPPDGDAGYNSNQHLQLEGENTTVPRFDLRVCVNVSFVSICVTLSCDLHWTDIIQPGLGQLLGHEGCTIRGQAVGPSGDSEFSNTEGMVQSIEQLTRKPIGSLETISVTTSPTFPLPDGNDYRVVAKTYPVLKGSSGRYVPFEVELVNKKK